MLIFLHLVFVQYGHTYTYHISTCSGMAVLIHVPHYIVKKPQRGKGGGGGGGGGGQKVQLINFRGRR